MSEKGPPPAYQSDYPQPGGPAPSQPNEAPPKYEAGGNYQNQTAYPPQGSYPQQQGYQSIGQQPLIIQQHVMRYGPDPQRIQCPNCGEQVVTSIQTEAGAITWLASGLICIVGCWLGCCLIPFCINDLQDVKHTCPNCNKTVGLYRRI